MLVTHTVEKNKAEKLERELNKSYVNNIFFPMKLTILKQR